MNRLWSPWREKYILSLRDESKDGCVFCSLKDLEPSSENFILYKGKFNFIVMNKFPYNNGHILIVPYNHFSDITDLSLEESKEMMELLKLSVRVIRDSFSPQGFNIGSNLGEISGAGIADHMHFHVVPRWSGDTNFMPVISETKVISQYMEQSWESLKKSFDSI